MEEIIEDVVEPTYKTMYAEFDSLEDYEALNYEISNHPLKVAEWAGTGTIRYAPESPQNINGKYYMEISAKMQELFPERAEQLTLVDSIPQIDFQTI